MNVYSINQLNLFHPDIRAILKSVKLLIDNLEVVYYDNPDCTYSKEEVLVRFIDGRADWIIALNKLRNKWELLFCGKKLQ